MRKYLSLLIVILFSGLSRAQNYAVINCTATGIKDGSKVYLVPTLEGERDSCFVQNGSFQFKVPVSEGTVYSIRLSKGYENNKWMDFYVDTGVLNISIHNATFRRCVVSGSSYAKDFDDYQTWLASHGILDELDKLSVMQQEAEDYNDTILLARYILEYRRVDSVRTVLATKWALDHPSSGVSAFVLFSDARLNLSIEELDVALSGLLPESKKNAPGKYLLAKVDAAKITAIGRMAPDFVQQDTSGNPVSVRMFRGKTVLIDFWASWCIPCREENPILVAAFEKFSKKGFSIISVSLDSDKGRWIQAIRKDRLAWTHVSDLKYWDNEVAKLYGISSVPFNLLLDKDGKIIAKNLRGQALHETLFEILR